MKKSGLLLLSAILSCAPAVAPTSSIGDAEADDDASLTTETETYGAKPPRQCTARGALPDPTCTPGGVMTTDLNIICHQSTKDRRNVPTSLKRQVFVDYGFHYPQPRGTFECDHKVPLCAGGSNDITNLWPQAAAAPTLFHVKDKLEDRMCRDICDGKRTAADVQNAFMTDWVSAYKREFGEVPQ